MVSFSCTSGSLAFFGVAAFAFLDFFGALDFRVWFLLLAIRNALIFKVFYLIMAEILSYKDNNLFDDEIIEIH
jgi:uncharacterized membrane protein YhdT